MTVPRLWNDVTVPLHDTFINHDCIQAFFINKPYQLQCFKICHFQFCKSSCMKHVQIISAVSKAWQLKHAFFKFQRFLQSWQVQVTRLSMMFKSSFPKLRNQYPVTSVSRGMFFTLHDDYRNSQRLNPGNLKALAYPGVNSELVTSLFWQLGGNNR